VDRRPGGSELLHAAALEAFGDVDDLPYTLRPNQQVRSIARFAKAVVAAARLGDMAAKRILDDAARGLGELAIDAATLVVHRGTTLM
jgi:N-acetylglucosamine kinase-like BadF-type ATPase